MTTTTSAALASPPAAQPLFVIRCADRRRAAHYLRELRALALPPHVGAALRRDGQLDLVLWFAQPTSSLVVNLLGYEAQQLRSPGELDLGWAWLTGSALRRYCRV
jgi:hypothetical protein